MREASDERNPMQFLRAATAERHARLEQRLDLLRFSFTPDDYLALLQRFYGFWEPWEALMTNTLSPETARVFQERKRSARLRSDLEESGFTQSAIYAVPVASKLPALRSDDAAFRSMYVTEGSTLGGQLLSKHFINQIGIRPEQCTFFGGYGSETSAMWKRFAQEISARPQLSCEIMAQAANETFRCLEHWLCQ